MIASTQCKTPNTISPKIHSKSTARLPETATIVIYCNAIIVHGEYTRGGEGSERKEVLLVVGGLWYNVARWWIRNYG
jgi:hypothetical protein